MELLSVTAFSTVVFTRPICQISTVYTDKHLELESMQTFAQIVRSAERILDYFYCRRS